ncbi:hypothetical protein HUJ04_001410 [Dendroctonus ponderosae]|nr:hypothetical protein HUJ04_001410 [Dendroctonus ponderosae]
MWAVWSVLAVCSIFESLVAQNHNETAQNQTDYDIVESLVEKRENLVEFNKPNSSIKASQKLDNFRPSPQLETYFEYNKTPVKPAHPEAKTIPRYGTVTSGGAEGRDLSSRRDTLQAENDKPGTFNSFAPTTGFSSFKQSYPPSKSNNPESKENEASPWVTKNLIQEDTPWVSRVRFPSERPQSIVISSYSPVEQNAINFPSRNLGRVQSRPDSFYAVRNEVPYPAHFSSTGNEESRHQFSSAGSNSGRFDFNKLVEVPKSNFGSYYPHQTQKTFESGYNLMEKPSYGLHEHSQEGGYGMSSSWKKILKLLAIFIPIGLLISALTPTVLTVTNVNDTSNVQSSRYRTNDATKRELHSQILSSLDYFDKLNENGCEYRVFCELLLTARQMPNSEQHVQNLFDNLATQDKDYKNRAEDLKKVFDAVRHEDCNLISCDFINNPP